MLKARWQSKRWKNIIAQSAPQKISISVIKTVKQHGQYCPTLHALLAEFCPNDFANGFSVFPTLQSVVVLHEAKK